MTKARTYFNCSVRKVSNFLLAIAAVMISAVSLTAQCTTQLLFNGVDVTGQTSLTHTLAAGECAADLSVELVISGGPGASACTPSSTSYLLPSGGGMFISSVTQVSTSFPIGATTIDFVYNDDASALTNYPTITLTVNPFPNPITTLACNNRVQVSLDENCEATILPDMVLEGGPYKCYDEYIVEVEDDRGNLIDRDPLTPGVQLDGTDFGNCYKSRIIDPATGNSCWGEVCIEDKLAPRLDCGTAPITVDCGDDISPDALGYPTVDEACSTPTLTYTDLVEERGCGDQLGLDRIVYRTWKAVDASGNEATCTQVIWVRLGSLATVSLPENYDDIANPALECDEKFDANKDVSQHIVNFPLCVDGYLLDSALWLSSGGDPLLGDLSGQRHPKVLGWNCIPNGPYEGHPSPEDIYYDAHPQNALFGACWGEDDKIMWQGTGYPTGADCSNINYTFTDTRIDLADPNCNAGPVGCYKILRKWTLLDWCTGAVEEGFQVIKVLDKEGPTITYPDEVEVGMVSHACTGVWNVTPPWITDNCSEDVDYELWTSAGTIIGNALNGFTVIDLPAGRHLARITASDCCGQTTVHELEINVVDNVPPVAICDDRTIISLTGNPATGDDKTKLCAESLDNGSYDNCANVYFKVIRMESLLGTVNGSYADNTAACLGADGDDDALRPGGQVYFDDCAVFCCADVGNTVMVVLRVFDVDPGAGPVLPNRMDPFGDLEGRFTDCMVEVEVQDKSNPVVVAPPDLVVSCMYWFDDSEDALSDPDHPLFGRVVTSVAERQKVKTTDKVCEPYCEINTRTGYLPSAVQNGLACDYYNDLFDPAHPDDLHELTWGFDGYVLSTCGTNFNINIIDERECGQGLIIREVVVQRGNTVFRDRQNIWVVDCDPFYVSDDCRDNEDDIRWPLDCRQPDELEGCGNADTSPDNPLLGRPEIVNGADDHCAMITIDYKDEVLTVEPDACYKIIRTWIVVDWCLYDPLDPRGDGRWEYVQVIKVQDRDEPVVMCGIGDCEPAVKDTATKICYGHLELTVDADDECTPDDWLNYEYKIDLNNDGSYDAFSGPAKPGQAAFNYNNPFADDAKNSTDASGTYPVGVHRISWFIEDGCGNVGICDTVFVVEDCKRPTPYCKTGIITVVMPSSGMIQVWANDLDAGSFDNCTHPQNLKFYFNGDPKRTGYKIDCDTFLAKGQGGKVILEVEVWVEDEEGNADFCRTTIEVQDPNGVCGTTASAAIAGSINTELDQSVEEVEVDLMEDNNFMELRMTKDDGYFAFNDLTLSGNYEVAPIKDGDYLNGVSTKDLVRIQRHLLGMDEFTSPYKYIAADANNSGEVSSADISAIRKVILGINSEFAKVNSWRFVPEDHVFEDVKNPWYPTAFPEKVSYSNLQQRMMSTDFVAVKVGDVTDDAKASGLQQNGTRSQGMITLEANNQTFQNGDVVSVNVSTASEELLSGYQFTLEYDTDMVELGEMQFQQVGLTAANFAVLEDGVVTVSWNDFGGATITGEMFTLEFVAKAAGSVDQALNLNSNVTKAEAYDQDLNNMGVNLTIGGESASGPFELYQNTPNPFGDETVIGFDLPQNMSALLTIYDVMGKVVRIIEVEGQYGYNEVSVQKADLNATGILYYQLDAGVHTSTKKMILMN